MSSWSHLFLLYGHVQLLINRDFQAHASRVVARLRLPGAKDGRETPRVGQGGVEGFGQGANVGRVEHGHALHRFEQAARQKQGIALNKLPDKSKYTYVAYTRYQVPGINQHREHQRSRKNSEENNSNNNNNNNDERHAARLQNKQNNTQQQKNTISVTAIEKPLQQQYHVPYTITGNKTNRRVPK